MPRVSLPVLAATAMLALAALFARFHDPMPDQPAQDTAALLNGTWEREYGSDTARLVALDSTLLRLCLHYPKIERVLIAVQFGRREARVSLRESP